MEKNELIKKTLLTCWLFSEFIFLPHFSQTHLCLQGKTNVLFGNESIYSLDYIQQQ